LWFPAFASTPALEIRGDRDVLRLTLELPAGMLVDAVLTSRGTLLELRLKDADRGALTERVDKAASAHPFVKAARVFPAEAGITRVVFEFSRPLAVVDELLVALADKMSRWEMVLGPADLTVPPSARGPATLTQITAARNYGRLDIVLSGSPGLVAEASLVDSPPRLVVDLPGVPLEQARSAADKFHVEAGLIRAVRALTEGGQTRLQFELTEPADLIDTQGGARDGEGQVLMSLVPDAQAKPSPTGTLGALALDVAQGVIQFRFAGIAGSRTNAFTLEEPPRLVVDFLGWEPRQLNEAISRFRAQAPAVIGEVRLDTTRLGSARAVFDLAGSAPLHSARAVTLPGEQLGEVPVESLLVALTPGASVAPSVLASGRPLDLRYRRELSDGRTPEVVIRPPSLESASQYASAVLRPDVGTEFGLIGMLEKAKQADPKFAAAKAEFDAISEAIPQARAGLLPSASIDLYGAAVRQDVMRASNPAFPTGASDYPNRNLTLSITQPLYKPQAWRRLEQAELVVDQGKLHVALAEQDLMLRVATSYLNLMAANDALELSRAERQATEKQNELARSRVETGLGTLAQRHDTEARLAINQAREIEAETRVDDARLALKEIIGESVLAVRGFKSDFNTAEPVPSAYEPWVQAALDQNLAVQSRKLAVEIAGAEIARQRAGHLPVLNLVGNMSRSDTGGSIYGAGQKLDNRELGLRLSVPLTDGGLTSSLTRDAIARKEKAEQEREQEVRRTERQTRAAFNGVLASARSMEALRKSIVAQESALQSRLQGFSAGLFNVVTVMDAYRLYYAAQRDFLQARYDYLTNRLKLKQAVGTLNRADLEDLSAMLN
jgi:outer membrane protein